MAKSPITRLQERSIVALLECRTLQEAASRVQVSERTLRNWLQLPAFMAAYRNAGRQLVQRGITRVQGLLDGSIDTLQRLQSCSHPPTERAAAEALMNYATRGVELGELIERLEAVEQVLKERHNQ